MEGWHTLSSLLHLIALALWLGVSGFFLVVFGPAVRQLEPQFGIHTLERGRKNFEAISWIAIGLLFLTGIFNLIWSSQAGAVPLAKSYVIALSIKLFLFLAMLVHHCLQVFKYGPQLIVLTAQAPAHAAWPEPLRAEWQKWFTLLKINVTLGPIVTLMGLMLTRG
jgi:uncharacterized membrane protein